jgi:hypothetical protein
VGAAVRIDEGGAGDGSVDPHAVTRATQSAAETQRRRLTRMFDSSGIVDGHVPSIMHPP